MSTILECLNRLRDTKLGTVVHVNPSDADVVERYAQLGATRVVLVSADPDALPLLRQAAQGRPEVEVIEAAVAPTSGDAQWLRFNVRELSGLLEGASGLRTFYPRLQVVERLPVVSATLQGLLERIAPKPADKSTHNLLVLEAPGLDGLLLQGLTSPLPGLFGLVLVRGARAGLYENAVDQQVALRWLHERHYRAVAQADDTDPLWPTTLLRFDQTAAEQAALAKELEQLRADLGTLVREHDAAIAQLTKARDEQAKLALDREQQAQKLQADRAHVEQVAQERLAQIEQLTRARDEQVKLAAERQAQVQALTESGEQSGKLAQERLTQIEQLTKAHDEQVKQAAERLAQIQALTESGVQSNKLAQERLTQIEQLTKAHDEQVKQAAERLAQIQALTESGAQSNKLAQERLTQIEQLTKARDEQTKLLAERDVQIQALVQGKAQAEKLAQERQAQLEQLTKAHEQQAKSLSERLAHSERHARERQARLIEVQRNVAQFEEEQRATAKRQQMLYEELLKAEAQLELIKDVTLREPGL